MHPFESNEQVGQNANPEKISDYSDKLLALDTESEEIENAMFGIIDIYSEAKSNIRLELADKFGIAQDSTKKTAGIEILELFVVSNNKEL